jgi:hypothetical protein
VNPPGDAHKRIERAILWWVSVRNYRLTVEGELSDRVAAAFAGMTLTRIHGTTVLEGPVRDQAELQGMLQRVSSLGLTLISAAAIDSPRRV